MVSQQHGQTGEHDEQRHEDQSASGYVPSMTSLSDQREIHAPADQVWSLLVDVARWPTWTPSMREVTPLQPCPLAVGHRVRVVQPHIPEATYTVDRLEPGRIFSWNSSTLGVTTRAVHEVEPTADGCRVSLTLSWTGLPTPAVALIFGRTTRTFLRQEVEGLKELAERPRD